MEFAALSIPAVIIITVSSTIIFVSNDWRWTIGSLGLQYLGVYILVGLSWPADLAAIKLVIGWMSASILGITQINYPIWTFRKPRWPTELIFRLMMAGIVILTVASIAYLALEWVPEIDINQSWGGLVLLGIGLVQLGFSSREFRMVLSLLTLMAGFEILYSVVEASTLVAGLLAVINLGIALVGAYLMTLPTRGQEI